MKIAKNSNAPKSKNSAAAEVLRLLRTDKKKYANPEHVVIWAKNHPNSALHGILEWDDTRAGHQYRVMQVYAIIRRVRVKAYTDAGPITIRGIISRPSQRLKGSSYMTAEEAIRRPNVMNELIREALREIQYWRKRHATLTALQPIHAAIDKVTEEFEAREEKDKAA